GDRLNFAPNYTYTRNAEGSGTNTSGNLFGYNLTYMLSPSMQLHSSLSNNLVWNTRQQDVQRTTLLTVGVTKRFNSMPTWVVPHEHKFKFSGQVYRDNNINGVFNQGEPGLAGLAVELENGKQTTTDAHGHFEFSGLERGTYRVVLPLAQFHEPVRVTNAMDVSMDLFDQKVVKLEFGVVNFARVLGSV